MKEAKIPYPTQQEKEESIRRIVSDGTPAPQSLTASLPALYRTLGLRGLFFGVGDCLFLGVLLTALVWCGVFWDCIQREAVPVVLVFFLSPVLYAMLHLLTVWKERMTGTYEQLMVCRCTLRQLTCLRMLVFGGVSVALTVFITTGLKLLYGGEVSFVRLLGISASGLFLFAAAQLWVEEGFTGLLVYVLVPVLWGVGAVACLLLGEKCLRLIEAIPTAVFWTIAILSALAYGKGLSHYYFIRKEGAINRAIS